MWASVCVRLAVLHPIQTVKNACKDMYWYFKHHDYDRYDGGLLNDYFAHFGGGKTLSVTHYVQKLFFRYNNKKSGVKTVRNSCFKRYISFPM